MKPRLVYSAPAPRLVYREMSPGAKAAWKLCQLALDFRVRFWRLRKTLRAK